MSLIGIFIGVIGRHQELAITGAIGSGPVDSCGPVIEHQLPVNPQLNAAGGRVGCPTNLEAAGEFDPLVRRIMGAGRIQGSGIIRLRVKTRSRAPLTCGLRKSATRNVLDAVVVGTLLTVHLRNAALPAIDHGGFE